jgi:hypothetical protein
MNRHVKPISVLGCGIILTAGGLCQSAHADLDISGTSVLADSLGAATPPEALTVSWSVVESGSVYTYSYTVNNPPNDTVPGSNPTQLEFVDTFGLNFAPSPDAVISLPSDGGANGGVNGVVFWSFSPAAPIAAGSSSPSLFFQSDLPPSPGIATASDDDTWGNNPESQYVPVPGTGNFTGPNTIPDSTATFALLAGTLLLLPFVSKSRMVKA